jgi:tetratricopeptide (TPR) repeat protein
LALAVAAWFGARWLTSRWSLSYLPDLPDLAAMPEAQAELIAAADTAARSQPASAAAVGHLGKVYFANLDYDRAARCSTRAGQLDPADWRWPYCRVLMMEERGETSGLLELLNTVIRLKPDHGLAWYRLGMAEFKQRNDDAAVAAFQRAIDLDLASRSGPVDLAKQGYPLSAHARLQLARALLRKGEPQRAVEVLTAVLAEYPQFGPARRQLGQTYQALGREAEGARELKRAASSRPFTPPLDPFFEEVLDLSRSSTCLLKQAGLAMNSDRLARAEELLRRARQYEPGDAGPTALLVEVLMQRHEPKEALPYLTEVVNADVQKANVLVMMATCLNAVGRRQEAAEYYRRAMKLDPEDIKIGNNYAIFLLQNGQTADGEALLRQYLRNDPESPELNGNMAKVFLQKGRPDEAIECLRRAVAVRPESVALRFDLAGALFRTGQTEECARQLREALEYQPDNPQILTNLAELMLKSQDFKQAKEYAGRLVQIAPNSAEAHWSYARAAAKLGEKEDAVLHCRTALRLKPDFKPAQALLGELSK